MGQCPLILHEMPPAWIHDRCEELFGANFEKGTIYTYWPTIYAKDTIPEDWVVHEHTHLRQQEALGPEIWWKRYFEDSKFRMGQEIEAYRAQLDFIRSYCNDRNLIAQAMQRFAIQLATLYKLGINQVQAFQLLKIK